MHSLFYPHGLLARPRHCAGLVRQHLMSDDPNLQSDRLLDRLVRPGNQPLTALERRVGPQPVEQHREAVAVADQEIDVDDAPQQPGDPAAYPEAAEIGDRDLASDRRHAAGLAVAERRNGAAFETRADD